MATLTIPASRARKELFDLIERVQHPTTPYVRLTVKGEGRAVMMSEEEWDGWMETMDILSNPKALANIKASREAFARGDYVTLEHAFPDALTSSVAEPRAPYGRVAPKRTLRKKRRVASR